MPAKLITKASCLGILGSTAYVSTIVDVAHIPLPKEEKTPDFKPTKDLPKFPRKAEDVTMEDVELYEASGQCKFIFVDRSLKKQIFKANEWLEEKMKTRPATERNYWRSKLTIDVFYGKFHCKPGQQLILELGSYPHGSFKRAEKL